MTALARTQRRMLDALTDPEADPALARSLLAADGRLGAAGGLEVYRRGYLLRIAACMREQFPALCHALGRALFDDFVAEYIRDCPPERQTLYDLGRRFSGWLEANRPDADEREPWVNFMIDLARFEYAAFTMFDAEGHEGRSFATADLPDSALRLQPAFALGSYGFPVAGYYHAVRRGEAPALPPPAPCHVALVRSDYITRTVPLSEAQHTFLAAMLAGRDAADALTQVSQWHDQQESDNLWRGAQGSRERWISWGFFVAASA